MNTTRAAAVDATVLARVHNLYGRQSHLIDSGAAADWARTFTPDGEFHSPSYPKAVVGTAELTAFAAGFAVAAIEAGERHRHVITNIAIESGDGDSLTVRAYLQIVATAVGGASRLVRFTTVTDTVVPDGDDWLIARRDVERDDAPFA
jgi:3-phenylpropionate/cinnamic acid dioxygenase small subunit